MHAERIIGIRKVGKVETMDIEVDNDSHLFFANGGIATSNSHAVEYSVISYWDAYLKHYYPLEFYASSLSFNNEDKCKELLEDAVQSGLRLQFPKFGKSHATKWQTTGGRLVMPFTSIKGIGEASAEKIVAQAKKKQGGFFKSSTTVDLSPKEKEILRAVGAYEPDKELGFNEVKRIQEYFPYNFLRILDF